ncbi:fimbrial biogenesis chaperone [Klebsiella michiganensis]|uniref:fimbrial biogenesis chaperone n=1 Tax=Klebsiella michiganensis TaxID=1134687 RepID=UPI00136A3190|nr:molecular chaperone [Klebsiella michiganensis]MXJ84452.1 fimbria/pilus periplasmic chaperone [Klebsiella michiganensis]
MKVAQYILAFFCTFLSGAYAGVMPSQSRIVYRSDDKDASIMLANTNNYPVLVQAWVDKGEGSPDVQEVPFISIPPVFYLEPAGVKGVRIFYNNAELSKEKESLFWFNIYEIPPERKNMTPNNSVLVTMNTQIKLFYRPRGLNITPEEAIEKITCKVNDREHISCFNPNPIHISVTGLQVLDSNGVSAQATNAEYMLNPFGKTLYHFKSTMTPFKVSIQYIDDLGNKLQHVLNITS